MTTTASRRRRARVVIVAAALVLAVVGAALAFLRTQLTGSRLAALITSRADAALAGRLELASASLAFPLHVQLEGVTLRDPSGRAVLTAGRIDVDLAVWPLLRHTLAFERIAARDVWADLATRDTPHGRGLAAAVQSRDRTPSQSQPWALRLRAGGVDGLTLALAVSGAAHEVGPARVALSEVALDPGDAATVGSAEVSVGGSSLRLAARASGLSASPAVSGHADATLVLGELDALARSLGFTAPAATGTLVVRVDGELGRGAASGRATLHGGPLTIAGVELGELACEASGDAVAVRIERCTARPSEGGALHLAGRVPLEGTDRRGEIVLEDVPARAIAERWLADAEWVPEQVDGVVDVAPPARSRELARLTLRLETRGVHLPRVDALGPVTTLTGAAALGRDSVDRIDLALASGSVRATARGAASLAPGGPVSLDVTLDDARPGWVGTLAPGLALARLQLAAHVGGSLAVTDVAGELTADGARYQAVGPFSVRVPLRLGPKSVVVTGARVEGAGGVVTADAELGLGKSSRRVPLRASLEARLDLSRVGVEGVAGRVQASATVTGQLARPTGSARVDARELVWRGVSLGSLSATVDADAAGARARGRLDVGRGTIDLAGLYRADGALHGEAHGRSLDLAGLQPLLKPPVAGLADLDVAVEGTARAPNVQGRLAVRGARVAEVDLGEITGELGGSTDQLAARLGADGPSGKLSLDTELAVRTRAVTLVAHATGLVLDPWLVVAGVRGYGGRADLDVHADGVLPYPDRLTATARVVDAVVDGAPIPAPLAVTAHSTETGRYQVDARLGELATLSAAVRRGPPLEVAAHATVEKLAVESLVPRLTELGVAVTTSGQVDATYVAPAEVSGDLTLSALDLTAGATQVHAAAPVHVRYARGEARIDELHLVGGNGIDFAVAGSAGRSLDLSLGGQVDLGIVAAFVPALAQASGAVRISGRASGTPSAPSITGQVDLFQPVVLRPRGGVREVTLEKGHITARTSGAETALEAQIQGALEGGAFSVSGRGTLAGLKPRLYDVAISGQNVPVRAENIVLETNGDLRVSGNASRALVSGTVDIVRGRYLKKFELRDFNFVARQPTVKTSLATEAPWLARVELDVTATSEAGLQLRVDAGVASVDLQLSSDVHVGGTAVAPQLEGRVEASRGTLQFPKAQLEVSQAVVDLGSASSAELDLRADGEVTPQGTAATASPPTYFIQLHLSGDLDQMALELTATPELNRLEILALLVRGEANLALVGGGGAGSSSTLDAALAFAGSQLTAPLSQFLSEQLERTLNLKLELGAEITSSGVRLTASQQVTNRLSIEGAYERSLGTAGAMTSARARLLLTDRLFLEGSTRSSSNPTSEIGAETSQSRLELKWRLFGL